MKESISLTWRRIPERYLILGSKCTNCGKNYFPQRAVCPKCRRKGKLERVRYSGKGKVHSFTEIKAASVGFEDQTPYVLAIIELEEGPRLTAQIADCSGCSVKIGDRVESTFRVIQRVDPEGLIHYGFKFKLVK